MSGYNGSPIASLPLLAGFINDDDMFASDAGSPLLTQRVPAGTIRTAPSFHTSGKYYDTTDGRGVQGAPAAAIANTLLILPFRGFSTQLLSTGVGLRVTVGSAGGAKAAVWELDPETSLPTGFPLITAQDVPGDTTGTGMIDIDWDGAGSPTWEHRTDMTYGLGLVFSGTPTVTAWSNTTTFFRNLSGNNINASAGGTDHGWTIAHTYTDTLVRDLTGASFSSYFSTTAALAMAYLKAQ